MACFGYLLLFARSIWRGVWGHFPTCTSALAEARTPRAQRTQGGGYRAKRGRKPPEYVERRRDGVGGRFTFVL